MQAGMYMREWSVSRMNWVLTENQPGKTFLTFLVKGHKQDKIVPGI